MSVVVSEIVFWKYVKEYGIFDEMGTLVGLRDDAPEEAKKSYEDFCRIEKAAAARGERL